MPDHATVGGDDDTQDLGALSTVSAWFVETCASITDDQWGLPTPCTDWTLEHLVDHVTGGNRFTVDILRGTDGDDALAAATSSFTPDHQVRSSAISSTEHQLQAFNSAEALDRLCSHLGAQLTGRQVLHIRIHELIIHTWDMAQAISPQTTIPQGLVTWAVAELVRSDSITIERFGIGPHEEPTGTLTAHDALLDTFGRQSTG